MILLTIGAEMLARLMRSEGERGGDSAWLLYGPSDPQIVAADPENAEPEAAWPIAAE